jgi:hypothetical protein
MCDPVENNLPRGRLGSLNRVLFRIPVKQDIQFRNLGNPAAVNFPAELDGELHESSLPPQESDKCFQRDQIRSPSAPGSDRSWAGSFLDQDFWTAWFHFTGLGVSRQVDVAPTSRNQCRHPLPTALVQEPQSSWFWIWRWVHCPREYPIFEEPVAILRDKRPEHFRVVQ